MTVDIAGALSAYNRIAKQGGVGGIETPASGGGSDFAAMVKDAAEGAIETLRHGEQQSMKAVAGTADMTEVVTAMAQAELTLQTVVSLRDRVISAYQEILRMPV